MSGFTAEAALAAQTTEMEAAIAEDLADLDLLDDETEHCYCRFCNGMPFGFPVPGTLLKTICGTRGIFGIRGSDCCQPCQEASVTQVCPVHGYVGP